MIRSEIKRRRLLSTDRRRPYSTSFYIIVIQFLVIASSCSAFQPLSSYPAQSLRLQFPSDDTRSTYPFVSQLFAAAPATRSSSKKKKKPKSNTICVNRVARRNYEILDTIETGIALKGTEVKSIRQGKMNLRDGYVRPSKDGRGCTLHNVHIGKYDSVGEYYQHEERRPRELLIHKEQARKLKQQTEQKGMTVVPLKAYFSDSNKVKIEIALCRGKNVRDKRADIKERDAKREENRIIKSFRL